MQAATHEEIAREQRTVVLVVHLELSRAFETAQHHVGPRPLDADDQQRRGFALTAGMAASPLASRRRVLLPGPALPPPRAPSAMVAAPPAATPPKRAADPAADLAEAGRLADQGRFVEAAKCCEEHLRLRGPSATAFYLLGLVRDATGNHAEASAFYRKALYLVYK